MPVIKYVRADELAAANERIRELETTLAIAVDTGLGTIATEREVSDKLEKALLAAANALWLADDSYSDAQKADATLAEVAAIRKGQT